MHLCQRIHFVSENNIKQLYLACFMNQHISFWAMKTKPLLLQERRITDPWPFRHLRPSLGRFLVPSNLQPHRPSKSVVPDDRCSAVPTSGSFLEPTPWYVVYLYVIIHIIYNIYIYDININMDIERDWCHRQMGSSSLYLWHLWLQAVQNGGEARSSLGESIPGHQEGTSQPADLGTGPWHAMARGTWRAAYGMYGSISGWCRDLRTTYWPSGYP